MTRSREKSSDIDANFTKLSFTSLRRLIFILLIFNTGLVVRAATTKLPSSEFLNEIGATIDQYQNSSHERVEDDAISSEIHISVTPRVTVAKENSTNFTESNNTIVIEEESNISPVDEKSDDNTTGGTTIYVVGIIGILPAAGIIAWCIRRFWKRSKQNYDGKARRKSSTRKSNRDRSKVSRKDYRQNLTDDTLDMEIFTAQTRLEAHLNEINEKKSEQESKKVKDSVWEFSRKHLRLKNVLGEGNFGLVWKAEADNICGIDGTILVAVKTVKSNAEEKEKQDLLNEMKIMKKICCHPNVVTMLGCCSDQEPYFLILEYVMYGKLLTYLRDHRSKKNYYNFSDDSCALTSQDLTTFAYHVARGMEYLSSKGILHRDLAARNILVDHTKSCKIADFGLSKTIKSGDDEMYEQKSKAALPIRWMAPESLFFSIFTIKSDVWSFGILMWEIVTLGSTPYPGMGARDVIKEVRGGLTPEKPHHCKPELYEVMKSCWTKESTERPHFTNLSSNLGQLLERQTGYIDLENFPDHCYFNMYYSTGEKV